MANFWLTQQNPFQTDYRLQAPDMLVLPQVKPYEMPKPEVVNTPVNKPAPDANVNFLNNIKPSIATSVQNAPNNGTSSVNFMANQPTPTTVNTPVEQPVTQAVNKAPVSARPVAYDNSDLGAVIDLNDLAKSTVYFDKDANRWTSDNAAARAFMNRESSGNANARNGNHFGVYQIGPAYWHDYGDRSIAYDQGALDPYKAHTAFINGTTAAVKALQQWGVTPTVGNAWIVHNQGQGGAKSLFLNPNKVLTGDAYTNAIHNMGKKQAAYYRAHPELLTGQAFIDYWNGK